MDAQRPSSSSWLICSSGDLQPEATCESVEPFVTQLLPVELGAPQHVLLVAEVGGLLRQPVVLNRQIVRLLAQLREGVGDDPLKENLARAPVLRVEHEPHICVAAFGLYPAPPGELTVDDECPWAAPVLLPEPLFAGHEAFALFRPEAAAREGHVSSDSGGS